MGAEADLVWRDGHSDYGNALSVFRDRYFDAVTSRSTVIVTGDARNNYRPTAAGVLADIAERARAVFWLNPEGSRYWDTGDSVMAAYTPLCDGVFELRTLRQLESFVESVALPSVQARTALALRAVTRKQSTGLLKQCTTMPIPLCVVGDCRRPLDRETKD